MSPANSNTADVHDRVINFHSGSFADTPEPESLSRGRSDRDSIIRGLLHFRSSETPVFYAKTKKTAVNLTTFFQVLSVVYLVIKNAACAA